MPRKNNRNSYNYRNIERDVRDIQRAGKRFKKSWINADGPLERILILLVVVAVIGVTIGMLLPKVNPTVGENHRRVHGNRHSCGNVGKTYPSTTIPARTDMIAMRSDSAKPTTMATVATCAKTCSRAI